MIGTGPYHVHVVVPAAKICRRKTELRDTLLIFTCKLLQQTVTQNLRFIELAGSKYLLKAIGNPVSGAMSCGSGGPRPYGSPKPFMAPSVLVTVALIIEQTGTRFTL